MSDVKPPGIFSSEYGRSDQMTGYIYIYIYIYEPGVGPQIHCHPHSHCPPAHPPTSCTSSLQPPVFSSLQGTPLSYPFPNVRPSLAVTFLPSTKQPLKKPPQDAIWCPKWPKVMPKSLKMQHWAIIALTFVATRRHCLRHNIYLGFVTFKDPESSVRMMDVDANDCFASVKND